MPSHSQLTFSSFTDDQEYQKESYLSHSQLVPSSLISHPQMTRIRPQVPYHTVAPLEQAPALLTNIRLALKSCQ
jgi:hypothetical protein